MKKQAAYKVIAIGDVTIDTFLCIDPGNKKIRLAEKTDELCLAYGEKIDVESFVTSLGGNAANVSVGLARLGIKTAFFSETGDDEFSSKIAGTLAKEGLDGRHVKITKHKAVSRSVIINYKGDRTLFAEHIKRGHAFDLSGIKAGFLYLTSLGHKWKGAYRKALRYAAKHEIKIIFNPGTLQLDEGGKVIKDILKRTEVLFVNKEEAERLVFGKEKYEKKDRAYLRSLSLKVRALGPETAVITDGGRGSYVLDKSGVFYMQKPFATELVDTTGAGDAYTAGFLGAVVHKLDTQNAMRWGSLNAASVVRRIGAQAGLLTRSGMEAKLGRRRPDED